MSSTRDRAPMDAAAVRALPPLVDLLTAASVLGMGRTTAYELARAGTVADPGAAGGRADQGADRSAAGAARVVHRRASGGSPGGLGRV